MSMKLETEEVKDATTEVRKGKIAYRNCAHPARYSSTAVPQRNYCPKSPRSATNVLTQPFTGFCDPLQSAPHPQRCAPDPQQSATDARQSATNPQHMRYNCNLNPPSHLSHKKSHISHKSHLVTHCNPGYPTKNFTLGSIRFPHPLKPAPAAFELP